MWQIWLGLLIAVHAGLMTMAVYELFTLWRKDDRHLPLTWWMRDVWFRMGWFGKILMAAFAVYWAALVSFALWLGPHWLVDR